MLKSLCKKNQNTEEYTMDKDTDHNVKSIVENTFKDALTEVIRLSARAAIAAAVQAELDDFINQFKDHKLTDGRQQIVRNGYHPERKLSTGVGEVDIKLPRIRDRQDDSSIVFHSSLIPPYIRRTKSLDDLLPLLYLNGISTNRFQKVLQPILGSNARNVSSQVICKLKENWQTELAAWRQASLEDKEYAYWWVDGVYLSARMENEKTCMLVIIGATDDGTKELVAFSDGFRECQQSWLELLRDIKQRGLKSSPRLVTGDGALGLWSALEKEHPTSEHQRCWVHKTANVLAKLPKKQQAHAKAKLKNIYLAATESDAKQALDEFVNIYKVKYPKAAQCLAKDQDKLLTFYHYPAQHWQHIRSTNPIESTFATVKHRTRQTRGCCSRDTILAAFFKLIMQAQSRWHRLKGCGKCQDVVNLKKFIDGISEDDVDKLKESQQNAA